MSRRVLKFTIDAHGVTEIPGITNDTFVPLRLGWQGQMLVLWAEAAAGFSHVTVTTVWTGEDVPSGKYVDSAQMRHQELGFLVVHAYVTTP